MPGWHSHGRRGSPIGAATLNYVGAVAIERSRRMTSVAVIDRIAGEHLTTRARALVNASGPWVDRVRLLEDRAARPLTRLSKGVHVVLPLPDGWNAGIALFDDSRSAFAVPWQGMLLIGTTDTPVEDDALDATPTSEDVEMLLGWFRDILPGASLRADRVVSLIRGPSRASTRPNRDGAASRQHTINTGPGGTVSIAGGKLKTIGSSRWTLSPTCRPRFGRAGSGSRRNRCQVRFTASPCRCETPRRCSDGDASPWLSGGEVARLLAYADCVPGALEPIHRDGPDVWAQAHFAVDEEMAVRAEDIALRRTTLGLRGLASAEALSELSRLAETRSKPVELIRRSD